MVRSSPLVRNLVRRKISSVVQEGRFDVDSARESLETSLRELQTDYIDLYLLHECELQDCRPDLLEFLQQARTAGKIRSFGAGTGFVRAERVCAQAPAFTEIAQFESSILTPNAGKIPRTDPRLDSGQRAIITHGPFAPAVPLRERIRTDPTFARRFRETLGVDGSDSGVVAGLILQHSLHVNPDGVVLFRSASPDRIATNMDAITDLKFSREQLDNFEALGAELVAEPVN
jgi:diketogulonate reductase-like aldo/keto reductase